MAERAGVKHLILTHLRAHMDASEALHEQMLAEARAAFSGTVEIAEDGRSLTL
jgi:ribonuclease BN (tRNA processing enzyme)